VTQTANRSAWLATLALLVSNAAYGQHDYANAVGDVEAQLGVGQRALEQTLASKSAATDSLSTLGPELAQSRDRLHRNARALYRIRRGGMLPVAGGMAALLGHASRISRLEQVVGRDLNHVKRLEGNAVRLRKELQGMDAQIAQAQREIANLQVARDAALRERTVHHSYENALTEPTARSHERVQYGLSVVGGAAQSESFTQQRGSLALPVSGPSSIQEATRAESDGPGLEFAASPGAAVRAAASGRVAFAETYGSYGKLVIVEHGERYYSVYGGLASMDVQVGDGVSKSARLGSSGSAPVYFEVRRGTKTQDARNWLGL
jgi:murein hydrolase activator